MFVKVHVFKVLEKAWVNVMGLSTEIVKVVVLFSPLKISSSCFLREVMLVRE